MTGALISAALAVGGVWFVVQNSISGMQTAIGVTNTRIDDVRDDLRRIDGKIDALRQELLSEFEKTRQEYKKASFDGGASPLGAETNWTIARTTKDEEDLAGKVLSALANGTTSRLAGLVERDADSMPVLAEWSDRSGELVMETIAVAPTEAEAAKAFAELVALKLPGCASIQMASDGTYLVAPSAGSIVGSNGFACPIN